MSFSTREPLPELQDCSGDHNSGSMPGSGANIRKGISENRNSGNFFPQISRSKGCFSAESTYSDCHEVDTNQDGRAYSDIEQYNRHNNTSRTSNASSVGISGKGSPTKLPHIDVHYQKSKSVTSLCSNRSRNTPQRVEICKSPSCPSLWSEYDDPGLVENGDLNASIHPHHTKKNTGDAVKLPELYNSYDATGLSGKAERTPETARSNSYNDIKKTSKIEKELQKLSMRKQKEEQDIRQRVRKTHRQQQLDRQLSQPAALLLPIRNTSRTNRDKKDSNTFQIQRQYEPSNQSYNATFSVKSDSGISNSLRQSDTPDTSYRAEESECSGWEEGEPTIEGQREEEQDKYEDAEEDDAGYQEKDEYDDANDGDSYYEDSGQCLCKDKVQHEECPHAEREIYEQEMVCEQYTQQEEEPSSKFIISGYSGPRSRRYKAALSQKAQEYQPRPELDCKEKCQEWLHGRIQGDKEST